MECSFCRKSREQVRFLVAPDRDREHEALICDQCVELAYTVLAEHRGSGLDGPLRKVLGLVSDHLDAHPEDAARIADAALHHGRWRELEGERSVVVHDAVAWWRKVLEEGRGRTVFTMDAPQQRCLGFAVYDEPDSPTGMEYFVPLSSLGDQLPEEVLAALATPRNRMAVCHMIRAGSAPGA